MLANCSSAYNESLFDPRLFLLLSSFPLNIHCFFLKPGSLVLLGFYTTFTFVMLPLSILIIYHGSQQWGKNSKGASMSHSDCFTYHLAIMEVIGVSGCIWCGSGIYMNEVFFFFVGDFLWALSWHGESTFHVLTCLERYLAVAHPISYLSLKTDKGIRIRNRIIVFVWLLCIAGSFFIYNKLIIINFLMLTLAIPVVIFCSISLLPVLNYPDMRGKEALKKKVDLKKQRAFYTILAILGALVLRFIGNFIWLNSLLSEISCECVMSICAVWLILPSSLVLPLLFLHKSRRIVCWNNIQ